MTFARRLFFIAGCYGLLALIPLYFLGGQQLPPLTHPEFFYGFVGVALAWQLAFFIIARDPCRYRLMMLPSIAEKLAFGIATTILILQNRAPLAMFPFVGIDLLFAGLFGIAYWGTPKA